MFPLGAENNVQRNKVRLGFSGRPSRRTSWKSLALELLPLKCCIKDSLTTIRPPSVRGQGTLASLRALRLPATESPRPCPGTQAPRFRRLGAWTPATRAGDYSHPAPHKAPSPWPCGCFHGATVTPQEGTAQVFPAASTEKFSSPRSPSSREQWGQRTARPAPWAPQPGTLLGLGSEGCLTTG